ncbi:hypothetical protein F5880DRAFT_1598864 [Lentinula raphanica]|nr:hypothetical protein F5880DRAFT_1598864 [Lentinula raphanica]
MKFACALPTLLSLGIMTACAAPIEETGANDANLLYTGHHDARAANGPVADTDEIFTKYYRKNVKAAERDAIDIVIAEREVVDPLTDKFFIVYYESGPHQD